MVAGFDLFNLLVENMFGNILVAAAACIALFAIIGAMMRMSLILITTICIFFLLMMFVGFYGGTMAVFILFGCSIYFVASLLPWVVGMLNR